ncbi:MAG: glycerol-3-phosphate cytidylyltransferase [Candidatus Azotimanducaceae bacterium]|jgi:glycerol-3-phosphate cytidylyltransferase
MKKIITYGTFDTLHFGHIILLQRAKSLGDYLIVGLSTDEFNAGKGKISHFNYKERKSFLEAIRFVDEVIPERSWDQKPRDVIAHGVDILTMGDDWTGEFDFLSSLCAVHYLSRTPAISSTLIKANMTNPSIKTG